MTGKRKRHAAAFKAKVALEAAKQSKTRRRSCSIPSRSVNGRSNSSTASIPSSVTAEVAITTPARPSKPSSTSGSDGSTRRLSG